MSFEEAATIPTGGLNALHFLRKVNIKQKWMIIMLTLKSHPKERKRQSEEKSIEKTVILLVHSILVS